MKRQNILVIMVDQLNGTLFPDGPADWLPRWRRSHCGYERRYVRAAVAWDLPLTTADADAVRRVARTC